jgi:hypothetical protein
MAQTASCLLFLPLHYTRMHAFIPLPRVTLSQVRSLMRQNELLSQSLAASERLLKSRDDNDRSVACAGRSRSRSRQPQAPTPRPATASYLAQFRPRAAAAPAAAKSGARSAVARTK